METTRTIDSRFFLLLCLLQILHFLSIRNTQHFSSVVIALISCNFRCCCCCCWLFVVAVARTLGIEYTHCSSVAVLRVQKRFWAANGMRASVGCCRSPPVAAAASPALALFCHSRQFHFPFAAFACLAAIDLLSDAIRLYRTRWALCARHRVSVHSVSSVQILMELFHTSVSRRLDVKALASNSFRATEIPCADAI